MEKEILALSRYYNFVENNRVNRKAITILENLNEEEREEVLKNSEVQKTILSIRKIDLLREIFRLSPAFFQEVMFDNQTIQNLLVSPRGSADLQKLKKEFNNPDKVFRNEELKKLEDFIHIIKSDKIREQLVDNKMFQTVVALSSFSQIERSFFQGIDTRRIFDNISSDPSFFFATKKSIWKFRKRNFLYTINRVNDTLLLTSDYKNVLKKDGVNEFIHQKIYSMKKGNKILIDKDTFTILNEEMLDKLLYVEEYIDKKGFEDYLRDRVLTMMNKEGFVIGDLAQNNKHPEHFFPTPTEFLYFSIASDYVKDNEKLKNDYIEFLFSHILRQPYQLSEEEIGTMKNLLFAKMNYRMMTRENFSDVYRQHSTLATIFYLKFNKVSERMYYLNKITDEQLFNVNVKHVNQIVKAMDKSNEDELSLIYGDAIKLYFCFGLERAMRILNGHYGPLNKNFFDTLGRLDITKVKMRKEGGKYIPIIKEGFIDYMFTTEKNNHFIDMLNNPDSLLSKYWNHFFEDFDSIKEQCHGNMSLNRLNIVLEQYNPTKNITDVAFDDYKLKENNILEEICLGNKTAKSNNYIYKTVVDLYQKMKRRKESSIPYVKGECGNGYSYEIMKLNDPIAFTLGYKANCCIRVNDIAHEHLLHATLCRNGRILIMYDSQGKVAGFSPLKRNGEVLIANSIECVQKIENKNTIDAFSKAIDDIVCTSKKSEKDPIRLVCIGREAYAKPNVTPFPNNVPTPQIYEKDDSVYANTDSYHRTLDIVYQDETLSLDNIEYGDPNCSYYDPREEFKYTRFSYTNKEEVDRALKAINGIRYASSKNDIDKIESFRQLNYFDIKECVYSDDWYILKTTNDKIVGEYLDYDYRAKEEYQLAHKEFDRVINNGNNIR